MHSQARLALKAASLRRTAGPYASRQFAIKHNVLGLYRLALQLGAIENA